MKPEVSEEYEEFDVEGTIGDLVEDVIADGNTLEFMGIYGDEVVTVTVSREPVVIH